ncbi:MAG: hypothetical protein A3E82_03880 [Gammaproteobacteria bacterium RIFCSPHIGHO2_12_FULL_38_11]|nr:MAG: hypothetical protein A3E82_03880 [Gammaproteobacteria bacterium RIFCSPHIGHO2_12_FULL_38_11]
MKPAAEAEKITGENKMRNNNHNDCKSMIFNAAKIALLPTVFAGFLTLIFNMAYPETLSNPNEATIKVATATFFSLTTTFVISSALKEVSDYLLES